MTRLRTILPGILATSAALLIHVPVQGATFSWKNLSNNWNVGTAWNGNVAPVGTNPLDVLVFGGSVGVPLAPTTWTATNNVATVPFQLNELQFNGTDSDPVNSGLSHTITGNALRFGGADP